MNTKIKHETRMKMKTTCSVRCKIMRTRHPLSSKTKARLGFSLAHVWIRNFHSVIFHSKKGRRTNEHDEFNGTSPPRRYPARLHDVGIYRFCPFSPAIQKPTSSSRPYCLKLRHRRHRPPLTRIVSQDVCGDV